MSMSFYCYTETDGKVNFLLGDDAPNFSNSNAFMILRSLGVDTADEYVFSFDADELLGMVTLARAISPVEDDGMPDVRVGNFVSCGVRAGYFASAYEQIAEVCEIAKAHGVPVVVA